MALTVSALVGAACSATGNGPAGPVIESQVAFPATVVVATSVVDPAAWTDDAPGGPALGAAPSAVDIRQVVEDVHGPTFDVTAEMRRFAPFPAILTPDRAQVMEIRADVRDLDDEELVLVTSEVVFSVDGTPATLATAYEGDLATQGWELAGARESAGEGIPVFELDFVLPDSGLGRPDLTMSLQPDGELDGLERTLVRVRYLTRQSVGDEVATRFVAWTGDLPLPDGSVVIGGGVHTSAVGRNTLHFSLAMLYSGLSPDGVASALRQALPAGGYDERQTPLSGDATDDWVHLDNSQFDRSWVSTQGGAPGVPTRVNVDANVGFEPRS